MQNPHLFPKKSVLFLLLLLPISGGEGQSFEIGAPEKVQISEIAPEKIADEDEWLEFWMESENAVDFENWTLQNHSTQKTFSQSPETFFAGAGAIPLAGQTVEITGTGTYFYSGTGYSGSGDFFTFAEDSMVFLPESESARAWFFWSTSPVSLRNAGTTLSLANEMGETLDEVAYPETKKGTTSGIEYAEIWNRVEDSDEVRPLIFRENAPQNYRHSKGESNFSLPENAENIRLLISEVSVDRTDPQPKIDFIEIFVDDIFGADSANLKYLEIKHNGTPLFLAESDFWVQEGDFLLVLLDGNTAGVREESFGFEISTSAKEGLSSGSGTVEVILFSGTSAESTEDFLCWKDEVLSQTESARVEKFRESQNWSGDCVEISELIKNESVARNTANSDSDSAADFFRHFNGSIGAANFSQNENPVAQIDTQGVKRIHKTSLNFTGENSSDADGSTDIESAIWTVNQDSCPPENAGWYWGSGDCADSEKLNPQRIKFTAIGDFEICLRVEDFSGASDQACDIITVTEDGIDPFAIGSGSASGFSRQQLRAALDRELQNESPRANQTARRSAEWARSQVSADFFTDFLNAVPPNVLDRLVAAARAKNSNSDSLNASFSVAATQTLPDENLENEVETPPAVAIKKVRKKRDQISGQTRRRVSKNLGVLFLP